MSPAASPTLDLGQASRVAASGEYATTVLAHRRGGAPMVLRGISKSFGGVRAVKDVDLDIAAGEIRAIIGPNGAGKSTLLNIISGIYAADSGSVEVGADKVRVTRASALSGLGIARTFQNLALFEGLDVAQNIAMGCHGARRAGLVEQLSGLGRVRRERADLKRRVDGLIDFLELGDVRDRHIAGLPYGIRKRIELARAIIAEPHVLLLDEPLAGMNGDDKPDMARFIRTTRDTFGTTIVLIEHDIGIVLDLADRIAVLDYGRKIADGTPAEVRRDPAVIAAYLGQDHEEIAA